MLRARHERRHGQPGHGGQRAARGRRRRGGQGCPDVLGRARRRRPPRPARLRRPTARRVSAAGVAAGAAARRDGAGGTGGRPRPREPGSGGSSESGGMTDVESNDIIGAGSLAVRASSGASSSASGLGELLLDRLLDDGLRHGLDSASATRSPRRRTSSTTASSTAGTSSTATSTTVLDRLVDLDGGDVGSGHDDVLEQGSVDRRCGGRLQLRRRRDLGPDGGGDRGDRGGGLAPERRRHRRRDPTWRRPAAATHAGAGVHEGLTGANMPPWSCARVSNIGASGSSYAGAIEHRDLEHGRRRALARRPRGRRPRERGDSAAGASAVTYSTATVSYGGDLDGGRRVGDGELRGRRPRRAEISGGDVLEDVVLEHDLRLRSRGLGVRRGQRGLRRSPGEHLAQDAGEGLVRVPLGEGGAQHLGDRLLAGGARTRRRPRARPPRWAPPPSRAVRWRAAR